MMTGGRAYFRPSTIEKNNFSNHFKLLLKYNISMKVKSREREKVKKKITSRIAQSKTGFNPNRPSNKLKYNKLLEKNSLF